MLCSALVELWRPRSVAAGKRYVVSVSQGEQPIEEPADPAPPLFLGGKFGRNGEREKCCQRPGSHGGEVAQPPGKAAMAHNLGSMPVTPEMDMFEGEVGGYDDFLTSWGP